MQCQPKNIFSQRKLEKFSKFQIKTIYNWEKSGKLKCIKTRGREQRFLKSDVFPELKEPREKKGEYVIVGSPPVLRKKIWKDKLSSSNKNIQIMKLTKIFV